MKTILYSILIIGACLILPSDLNCSGSKKEEMRRPAVSDQFYPGDPAKLRAAIDCYLKDAVTPFSERPIAIISPHAGYIYSGQICADAFKQASRHDYDLIVLLGTNHTTAGFGGVSVFKGKGYETPLGIAEIDQDLTARLIESHKDFTFKPEVHEREHSNEVMVPFVQVLFPEAKILPAVIGSQDVDLCTRFGETLATMLKNRNALIVASSDLSHYPDYEDALKADRNTIEAVMKMDPAAVKSSIRRQLSEDVPNLSTCACGQGPIMTAIAAAKALGATGAQIISYANSGNAAVGKPDRVVGYMAAALVAGSESKSAAVYGHLARQTEENTAYTEEQKQALLKLARKTIHQLLISETTPLARGFDPFLEEKKGAFVTLTKNGNLRGCIGHMTEDLPLCQVVGLCALQAAFADRRFQQVQMEEMQEIEIEISVLTPFRQVNGIDDILIGRDGILLEKAGRSAVYLPQVAVEQGWNLEQTLDHLCQKAGLSTGDWKRGATFYTFQSIVFSESELH
jgi:AmmeMemoRadiSam system protein B/AmmeMemoRadiSam system protein A